jgi:hypothetical protein
MRGVSSEVPAKPGLGTVKISPHWALWVLPLSVLLCTEEYLKSVSVSVQSIPFSVPHYVP